MQILNIFHIFCTNYYYAYLGQFSLHSINKEATEFMLGFQKWSSLVVLLHFLNQKILSPSHEILVKIPIYDT